MTFLGAVGGGDIALVDEVLKDLAEYPKLSTAPEAALAAELTRIAMMQVLRAPYPEPKWLVEFDLSVIPDDWRFSAALLALNRMIWRGETDRAAVLAEVMTGFSMKGAPAGSYPEVALKLARARIAHDKSRINTTQHLAREAAKAAKISGVIYPFLGKALGPKSPLELAFTEEAPDLLEKLKVMNAGFFRNLVKLHNHCTGESVVETLSPREFYLASALKHGVRYKEIAERMGIAYCRVNVLATRLYETLDIHKREELDKLVW